MNLNSIALIQKIEAGQLTRNRYFELFKRPEFIQARKAHARLFSIKRRVESGLWNAQVTRSSESRVEVILTSSLFAVSWKTFLSYAEWKYLRGLIPEWNVSPELS